MAKDNGTAFEGPDKGLIQLFEWDTISSAPGGARAMHPAWMRFSGLDEAEVLLYSPIDVVKGEPDAWEAEGALVAKVCGPSRKQVRRIMGARSETEMSAANTALIRDCVVSFPAEFKLRRAFLFNDQQILARGARHPIPSDLLESVPTGSKFEDLATAYIEECLPNSVRAKIHTAAMALAVPEVVALNESDELADGKPARMRDAVPIAATDDPNSGGASRGG